ncbi:MAG TPA: hypothetical protein VER14_05575 [Phototrophicaceae bacterium]|nr:hypothetical protein [Phototrophicaceae bacterium]
MSTEIKDIIDFLKISYPENESIIVGCRADTSISYECCEYDIIVLKNEMEKGNIKKSKKSYNVCKVNEKTLEIHFLNKEELIYNPDINFKNYIDVTNSVFKSNSESNFERKRHYNKENFNTITKRKSLKFALDCTIISKRVINGTLDQRLSSLYLKMMSFNVLELFIQMFHSDSPRPTHLKYQVNQIKENNSRIKENIDIVLDYLQLERSNISTITRSEKSLFFLLNHTKHLDHHMHNHKLSEILKSKLNYFKDHSMYVDASLLIHGFIRRQNLDQNYIKNYNRLLNQILDIQIKEKTILLKEIETLFNINKSLVKNIY